MRDNRDEGLLTRLYRNLFGPPPREPVRRERSGGGGRERLVREAVAPRNAGARPVVRVEPWLAFTPTQPRAGRRQLVGRQREHDRILQALQEECAHVVLYSERGRGKTSLTNMVVDSLRRTGQIVARHTCDAESTFDSIVHGLANDIPSALLARQIHDPHIEGVAAALPEGALRPRDVVGLLPQLTCRSLVCVIDEFDRIEDEVTRTRIADTIKQLSDRGTRMLFMIVGVSENLIQILGEHPSIQRNLVSVQLPLLDNEETCTILERGIRQANLTIEPGLLAMSPPLVRGNPYMAQLLGLRLTQATALRRGQVVDIGDLVAAISRLIDEAQPQDTLDYLSLTANRHDLPMVAALDALAAQEQDRWGHLVALADASGDVILGGRAVAPALWARIQAAGLLRPIGGDSGVYTFGRRSMMHHILLVGARENLSRVDPGHAPAADLVPDEPVSTALLERLRQRANHV
jgi:hypothetical protein